MRRAAAALAVVAAVVLAAPRARAQSTVAAHLVYRRMPGAESCPDEDGVRSAVAARLGFDPFVGAATSTITATLSRSGRLLEARIELSDAAGTRVGARTLTSSRADCTELASAAALAISIAIDPLSLARAAPPPAPAPAPAPAPIEPPVAPVVVAASPAPRPAPVVIAPRPVAHGPPVVLQASAGGGVAVGSTPSATPSLAAQFGARVGRFAIALEGRLDLPASATRAGVGTVNASLALATVLPCLRQPIGGGHAAYVCGALAVGGLEGSATGVGAGTPATTLFAAAGVRGAFELALVGPLSARVHAELLGTLTPTSLRIAAMGQAMDVWTTPPVAFDAGLALVVSFL